MRIQNFFLFIIFFIVILYSSINCFTRFDSSKYVKNFVKSTFLARLVGQKRYNQFYTKNRVSIKNIDGTLQKLQQGEIFDFASYTRAQLLGQSMLHLYSVPGFYRAFLCSIKASFSYNSSMIKGTYYEFERALELKKNGSQVEAFNIIISAKDCCNNRLISREFDIFAQEFDKGGKTKGKLWIECKNCNWQKILKSKLFWQKIKKQLSEQKKIVDLYNEDKKPEQKVTHQLSSKNPIPEKIKQFLFSQGTVWHTSKDGIIT